MAYELYINLPDKAPRPITSQAVVAAFAAAELPFAEKPDSYGHWLVLDGIESTLDLTIQDGLVTGAGFRYATQDDDAIIEPIIEVFKSLGFAVGDDEGEL